MASGLEVIGMETELGMRPEVSSEGSRTSTRRVEGPGVLERVLMSS